MRIHFSASDSSASYKSASVSYTHLDVYKRQGAEDFAAEEDSYEITTAPDDFSAVRETLEAAGIPMASAEVTMIPQTYTELTDEEDIKKMNKLLEMLDDDDDVQNTYHNWDE